MDTLFDRQRVRCDCTCGRQLPLGELFFCRYCTATRCGTCVIHEIEGYMCSQCTDTIPTAEARQRQYTCKICDMCPRCHQILTQNASKIGAPSSVPVGITFSFNMQQSIFKTSAGEETETGTSAKVYYLKCGNCHWTTRQANLADAETATGVTWAAPSRPADKKAADFLQDAFDYYNQLAIIDREEAKRVEISSKRRPQYFYSDRTPLRDMLAIKKIDVGGDKRRKELDKEKGQPWGGTNEGFDKEIPDSMFEGGALDLRTVSTLEERLACPADQRSSIQMMRPLPKMLTPKQLYRCRHCQHIVMRADATSSKVKFKIQHFAVLYVPEVKLYKLPKIEHSQKDFPIHLVLANPLESDLKIMLLPDATTIDDANCLHTTLPDEEITLKAAIKSVDISRGGVLDDTSDILSVAQARYGNFVADDTKLPNGIGMFFQRQHRAGYRILARTKPETRQNTELYITFIVQFKVPESTMFRLENESKEQQERSDEPYRQRVRIVIN